MKLMKSIMATTLEERDRICNEFGKQEGVNVTQTQTQNEVYGNARDGYKFAHFATMYYDEPQKYVPNYGDQNQPRDMMAPKPTIAPAPNVAQAPQPVVEDVEGDDLE